jgi:type 2 lantibiotic biosynthesis protein LanM
MKGMAQKRKRDMTRHSRRPSDVAALPQQTFCWYQAATLVERLASLPRKGAAHALDENTEAAQMVQRWKAQEPFDNGPLFISRLARDGITEQDLLALLAEPQEALQERIGSPVAPDWVIELIQALDADPFAAPDQDTEPILQNAASLRPFYPLLQKSITYVQANIKELACKYHALPFDSASILSLLLPNLLQQLQPQVNKTLALELNIARLRGHLHGETPEERFQYYLRRLSDREQLLPLLQEYTVLARQILLTSQLWANCSLEFLQRLCADWPEIIKVFAPEQEPRVLTSITGGAGDTHRGGHSVMILTFHSGWQLVYKPKSLTVDAHFQELLAWINEQGSHPAFRLLNLINKESYGWTEWIAVSGCFSEEEVAHFYERQGGYLALLYALDATDFHYENVIAAGEHPMLIDLEALFHPRNSVEDGSTRPARQPLEHSVLRSLLLPRRVLFNKEGEGIDVGGLSRRVEGQLSPHPVALWDGAGTDEMKLVRKRVELRGGKNCPQLHNREARPLDYIESLVKGFASIYRLLMSERTVLTTQILPRFARDEIRFVARSTHTYTVLLAESFHPNLLRDALNRERFFDRLWLGVDSSSALTQLIPAERADLLRGDIPLFTARPESLNLWTSWGERLPAFFARSSLELVYEGLQQLNEADLQQQIWFIRASFANEAGQRGHVARIAGHDLPSTAVFSVLDRTRLLMEARAIGDRLCARALRDKECADWIGLNWVMERDWQIAPAGLDMYGGLPGILLFLSYLGWITEETRYTDLAQAGLNTLRAVWQQKQAFLDQIGIGAFNGLSSCLYLFTHLAAIWHNSALLKEAEELAQLCSSKIENDEHLDMVNGSAGCLASLLGLYTLAPSADTLQTALECGEHLLACTRPMSEGLGWKTPQQEAPLSGFSHGVAGIALSLLRLAAVSGEQRFRDTAVAALAYERSLFIPERGNWLDVRKRPDNAIAQSERGEADIQKTDRCGMSWNHGAPGIALGRIASLPYLDDAVMRAEIEIALETTIREGFGYLHEQVGPNHSLLHGDCGNLETVLLATRRLQTPQLHDHLQRLTTQLLENRQQRGWVTGVPLNIETPGLLTGSAGIGYQCLRLAEPDRAPSVLILAPPTAFIDG